MVSDDEKRAEVVSFENAGHSHRHARKEEKIKDIKQAFKNALADKLSSEQKQKQKRKNSKNGEKKKR